MKNVKNVIKKVMHPFIVTLMLLIIFAGCVIIYYNKQEYATETWVYECVDRYSDELTELDMKILTNNVSSQIDKKLDEIDLTPDISDEQMMELMAVVNEELQYADYAVSQENLSKLSADIVKKVIAECEVFKDEEVKQLEERIDTLESQLTDIRESLTVLYNSAITDEQVKQIVEETALDEKTVRRWISELKKEMETTVEYYEEVYREMASILAVDVGELKEFIEEAKNMDGSISYLSKKLGVTEEKINAALAEVDVSNNEELVLIKKQIEEDVSELDDKLSVLNETTATKAALEEAVEVINENQEKTDSKISALNEATVTKEVLDETVQVIKNNQKETDKKIDANKSYTDAVIDEMEKNVLFYNYDPETNTLKLFEYTEKGE